MADAHPMPGPLHRASVAAAATAEPPCGMGFINTVCEFRDALETFCQKADKAEDPDWSKNARLQMFSGASARTPGPIRDATLQVWKISGGTDTGITLLKLTSMVRNIIVHFNVWESKRILEKIKAKNPDSTKWSDSFRQETDTVAQQASGKYMYIPSAAQWTIDGILEGMGKKPDELDATISQTQFVGLFHDNFVKDYGAGRGGNLEAPFEAYEAMGMFKC